uniref:V-SNARE coiled-coil homology domain-containing protein n=1 Tax=Rhodosorus marinus TaxID=101924 RepID=A0A6T6P735_9RHOD|mmetsp:Transcript_6392/g.9098  ORF Transcript_6392/g.9098 Transcript_6392/m.9098 type:complete len:230 (+) Transcript_6392:130-819(+)
MGRNSGEDHVRYVSIARQLDLLPVAEYKIPNGGKIPTVMFEDRVDKIMRSGKVRETSRLTVLDNEVGSIHFESEGDYVFLVFTASSYPQRAAFKLLGEIKKEYLNLYEKEGLTTQPLELSEACGPFLRQLCAEFNVLHNVDQLTETKDLVEEVKGQMQQNLEAAVNRGERLDDLLVQAENLNTEAGAFRDTTSSAKTKFWKQNMKLLIIIAVLVVILILAIVIPLATRN